MQLGRRSNPQKVLLGMLGLELSVAARKPNHGNGSVENRTSLQLTSRPNNVTSNTHKSLLPVHGVGTNETR